MELKGSLSFVGMELVLVIIKVKHRIMTSHIQYKIQYKYRFQYKPRTNHLKIMPKDSDIFSLFFLGNDATIQKMPLINVLVMHGNNYPVITTAYDYRGVSCDK